MLETAIAIARKAHASQSDKLDRDYVDAHLRPIAEAAAVFGEEAEASGWLHDVVEDAGVTADELRASGIPGHVVEAVESVTKVPGQEYDELIDRACRHPLGRFVKLVDNAWNITCNPGLAENDPGKAGRLMRKYVPARERLLTACRLDLESPEVVRMQEILDRHLTRSGRSVSHMARWICEYCTSTGQVPEGDSADQMSCPNCGEPVMPE